MKRMAFVSTIVVFVACLAISLAGAQDTALGDYARQTRKQKGQKAPAAKRFDNDNLPTDNRVSVVGQEPSQAADANGVATVNNDGVPASSGAAATPAPGADQTQAGQDKAAAEDEAARKKQTFEGWKKKIQDQQGQIDLLARELDILNREYRLRAASFYADAGNRLRNSGAWDKEDSQFKEQIAGKQKQLEDSKKQLDDMQEQARKAGVPSSMRE